MMTVDVAADNAVEVIELAGRLDTDAAAELRATLAVAEGPIRLDARDVEMVGGLAVEAFLRHPYALTFDAPSAALLADLATFGLGPDDFLQEAY